MRHGGFRDGNAATAKNAVFECNTLNQRTKLTRYQSIGIQQVDYTYDAFKRLVKRTCDADGAEGRSHKSILSLRRL
jgi:hypothetical protein